jgi:lambda repressor-like predicted transcriptional regulator
MHPDEIKIALKARGFTVVAFAAKLDVSREVIHNVIACRGRSKRIETAIAAEIDKPIWEVFPSRYKSPDTPTISFTGSEVQRMREALAIAESIINHAHSLSA